MRNTTAQTGFTLIELMVTLIVLSIVAMIAMPSFKAQIARQNIDNAANQFESCFKDAQIEARTLRRDSTVVINTATNTLACGSARTDRYDSKIAVTSATTMATSVRFNPSLKVSVLAPTSGVTFDVDHPLTYDFCYQGYTGTKRQMSLNVGGVISVSGGTQACGN